MSFNEMIGLVESVEFSSKMNLSSSRSLFFRLLEEDDFVRSFTEFVKNNTDKIIEILSRVELLSRLRVNPRYENPNDVAISVYCWILYQVSPRIGKIAATMAASAVGVWWANEVAVFVLEDNLMSQKNTNSVINEFNLEKTALNFSSKNRKTSLGENLPIPTLLFKDIAKYIILDDFKAVSTSSYLPESKSYEWKDYLNNISPKIRSFSEKNNDTLLAANWS